jgi:transposase
VDKMRDIVGLYLDPPHSALVSCVDEKSQIQALSRSHPVLPMCSGQLERRTHDYKRHGVTSLFAALDIATGNLLGKCRHRHRSLQFLDFLRQIDAAAPVDLDIYLVLDNYGTHKTALIRQWLQKRPRHHLHFTPRMPPGSTSSSAVRTAHPAPDQARLAQKRSGIGIRIREFIAVHNRQPKPFHWTKSADQILASIARFATSTLAAHQPKTYTRNQ